MGSSWTPPPVSPEPRSSGRSNRLGCWLVSGCAVMGGGLLVTSLLIGFVLWRSQAKPVAREVARERTEGSNPTPPPLVTSPWSNPRTSTPATNDIEATAAQGITQQLQNEVPEKVTTAGANRLELELPTGLQPISMTPAENEVWNYRYSVQLQVEGGTGRIRRDQRIGSLAIARAADSTVSEFVRNHSEFKSALETPGHVTLSFVDSSYRAGEGDWGQGWTPKQEGTVVVLENGVPLVADRTHAGTMPVVPPVELLFMPMGDFLENGRESISYPIRGRHPVRPRTSIAGTYRNESQKELFPKLWFSRYWPASERLEEEAVEAVRTYRFSPRTMDDDFASIDFLISYDYPSRSNPICHSTAAGRLLLDRRQGRILKLNFVGSMSLRDELGRVSSGSYFVSLAQVEPLSSTQVARWGMEQEEIPTDKITANPAILEHAVIIDSSHFSRYYRMSPDGRWLTAQAWCGTLLLDLDTSDLSAAGFWIGGDKRCYWDASSTAFARCCPPTWEEKDYVFEIFQQDEQGNWPVTPIRIPYSTENPDFRFAFDLVANRLVVLGSKEFECFDLSTRRSLWRRTAPSNTIPTSIHWSGDQEIKLHHGNRLIRLGLEQGETLSDFPLNVSAPRSWPEPDWANRFCDDGAILWIIDAKTVIKIDTSTGEELERHDLASDLERFGVGPRSDWVLQRTNDTYIVSDPNDEMPWLTIEGLVWNRGRATWFSDDGSRILLDSSEGGWESSLLLKLKPVD